MSGSRIVPHCTCMTNSSEHYTPGCPVHDPYVFTEGLFKPIDSEAILGEKKTVERRITPNGESHYKEFVDSLNEVLGYYFPRILSAFHCEHRSVEGWKALSTRDLTWVNEQNAMGNIRVPRLSENLLVEMGWVKADGFCKDCYIKHKKYVLYRLDNERISIEKLGEGMIFKGSCPTINEFMALMAMLNI